MVVTQRDNDTSGYHVSFPAHPDGERYTIAFASTEYNNCYRIPTATGFIFFCLRTNYGQGFDGEGFMSIMVLA